MMKRMTMRLTTTKTLLLFGFHAILSNQCSDALSTTLDTGGKKNQKNRPIKRIAIVGAGISGLSLAHAFVNSPSLKTEENAMDIDVSVYDSRSKLDFQLGSGVQLNGGLAILGRINPKLQETVIEAGVPIDTLKGRNKDWFDGSKESKLWDFDVSTILKSGGEKTAELFENNKPLWYGIMRGALQELLIDNLPIDVTFGKSLNGISSANGGGAYCEFADGSKSGPFDLIVGCDGIKSAVKEYIEKDKISTDSSKREGSAAALYSGIRIGYAVSDMEPSEIKNRKPRTIRQLFADGAYVFRGTFGNGKNRPPCSCVFIISLDNAFNGPFRRKKASQTDEALAENSDWNQDINTPKMESRERMIRQLSNNNIPGGDLTQIIQNSDRFFELGVYLHNPFSFAGWSKEIPSSDGCYAVLCGDSAHAMPPFLGQGANQAIQDAYSLAEKIIDYNNALETEHAQDLKPLMKNYENVRWPTTTSITGKAAILGYLETGGRNGFYSKFRDIFFKILAFAGVPTKVLIDSAKPTV